MTITASEYTAQRNHLITTVEAIPDIGQVHDRPRYGDARQHWVYQASEGQPHIRAWELGIDQPGTEVARFTSNHRQRNRHWMLRGFVGIEDDADDSGAWGITAGGSYHLINTLAGDIADALDPDPTWGGTAVHVGPAQISEPVVIPGVAIGGGMLCWGITLTWTAYTVRNP